MNLLWLLGAMLGGGTIATLVGLVLHYRADNTRTYAEGGKLSAEAGAVSTDSVQRRYDSLFDDFELELERLRARVDAAEEREKTCVDKLELANQQVGRLRIEAANATADVRLARAEIVTLQDRLDRLEGKPE